MRRYGRRVDEEERHPWTYSRNWGEKSPEGFGRVYPALDYQSKNSRESSPARLDPCDAMRVGEGMNIRKGGQGRGRGDHPRTERGPRIHNPAVLFHLSTTRLGVCLLAKPRLPPCSLRAPFPLQHPILISRRLAAR
jgi:hypothetical protein